MPAADRSHVRDGAALAFASLFPLAMAILYFVILDRPDGDLNPALRAAFLVGKAIQFLFPLAFVFCYYRDELGIPWPTSRGLAPAVGFAGMVGVAMFVLYFAWVRFIPAVADETPLKIYAKVKQFGADSPGGYLGLAFAISVIHSLAEEYYWRWFVFGWLRRHVSFGGAIALSALGFMLHHVVILAVYFPGHFWTLAMPFSICVAVGGAVWAWIYARAGSLFAPWVSHCLIDAAIMGIGYEMLERFWQ